MDEKSILEILSGAKIKDIKADINIRADYINLIHKIDTMPEMSRNFFDETRGLYHADMDEKDNKTVKGFLKEFFGAPSFKLRSITGKQTIFRKKVKSGIYYGELFPVDGDKAKMAVNLGFYGYNMSNKDYKNIAKLGKTRILYDKIFKEKDAVVMDPVFGINLAALLLIAFSAEATCALKIKKNGHAGHIYFSDGELIAAETEEFEAEKAAWTIIGWGKSIIEIKESPEKKKREISQSIKDIITEGLKAKSGYTKHIEKLTDQVNHAIKLKRKRILLASFAMLCAGFILFSGVIIASRYIKSMRIKKEYQYVSMQVKQLHRLEEQANILRNYVKSHDLNKFTADAENRIKKIQKRIERRDFDQIAYQLDKWSGNKDEMIKVYHQYLKKYPAGLYAATIKNNLSDLNDYLKLDKVAKDNDTRLAAYKMYLSNHPSGKYRGRVEKIISDITETSYKDLKEKIIVYKQNEKWDDGFQLCSKFIINFKDDKRVEEIITIKKEMQDWRQLAEVETSLKGVDYLVAKQIYSKFLTMNPAASVKKNIEMKLDEIEINIQEKKGWNNILAYCQDRELNYSDRIQKLKSYIKQKPSGQYTKEAQLLIKQLQTENRVALRYDPIKKEAKKKAAMHNEMLKIKREEERQRREEQKKRQEKERRNKIEKKLLVQLKQSNQRFVSNGDGTITDTMTGRMWCLVDSFLDLNKCIDYNYAISYVKNLATGNYRDWQLPSAGELGQLYQARPFLPIDSAKWYWSFGIYDSSFKKMARIVKSKRGGVFRNEYKEISLCGAVRAVRP